MHACMRAPVPVTPLSRGPDPFHPGPAGPLAVADGNSLRGRVVAYGYRDTSAPSFRSAPLCLHTFGASARTVDGWVALAGFHRAPSTRRSVLYCRGWG
ncbi:hypothetical protein ZWY2020_049027 [Hordeum vulgare]|nr:hypothetical protein ZWY2020_049027 [Hordeum vulgare]